jgi:dienelactone hydrolase
MTKLFALLLSAFLVGCSTVTVPVPNNGHTAQLTLNVKEDAKRGTVLVLNGCNGPRDMHYHQWASYIAELGYNTVAVDSFSSRGYSNICGSGKSGAYVREAANDVLTVGKWVKQQSWSNGHVAVIGFSLGGIQTLIVNTGNEKVFDGAIAYYPNCNFASESATVQAPMQVHIGTADEWAPVSQCHDLAKAKNYSNVEFYFYNNAHHLFDGSANGMFRCKTGTCRVEGNSAANDLSRQRVKKFLKENLT